MTNQARQNYTRNDWVPLERFARFFDGALSRIGLRGTFARDCVLSVVIAALSIGLVPVALQFTSGLDGSTVGPAQVTVVTVIAALQALILSIRRVAPAACLVIVVVLQVTNVVLLPQDASFRGIAPLIAAYTVGAVVPVKKMLIVVTAVVLLESTVGSLAGLFLASAVQKSLFGVGHGASEVTTPIAFWRFALAYVLSVAANYFIAMFIGYFVSSLRENARLMRARASEVATEQRARVDVAIGAERSRMARELHDIAAHHLSGMVVQASAVERLIDRDPDAAKEATRWIRGQGKETLTNMRLVVGMLRDRESTADDRDESGRPVPGLGVIDELLETTRTLGSVVELVREGRPYELPPIADVAFYRVLQESLSNARQHAPGGRVTVSLTYRESAVELRVENTTGSPPPRPTDERHGLGLVGMRERAALIGASFYAGPMDPSGWRVSLLVPREVKYSVGYHDDAIASELR